MSIRASISPRIRQEDATIFPDVRSSPSQINSYMIEKKYKMTLPAFTESKRTNSIINQ